MKVEKLLISPHRGRLYIGVAAVLWSLSGVFAKTIALPGPTMACLRALFAGLALMPLMRPNMVSFRPAMLGMVACFTAMNLCYVTALTVTSAANAIFLQYTAPAWMSLASVYVLREPVDRRSLQSLVVGLAGIAIIVFGGLEHDALGIALGLAAGMTYGGVVVFLRVLRGENAVWLVTLNHLVAGIALVPFIIAGESLDPFRATPLQLGGMAAFGIAQMAIPYVLFARGLTVVSPQEAGLIALLEPVLNPLLTYLVVGEVPALGTLIGGAIILTGLAWRYAGASPELSQPP